MGEICDFFHLRTNDVNILNLSSLHVVLRKLKILCVHITTRTFTHNTAKGMKAFLQSFYKKSVAAGGFVISDKIILGENNRVHALICLHKPQRYMAQIKVYSE